MSKSETYDFHRCLNATVDIRKADNMVRGCEESLHLKTTKGGYKQFCQAERDHWRERQKLAARQVEKHCAKKDQAEIPAYPDPETTPGDCRDSEGRRVPPAFVAGPGNQGGA